MISINDAINQCLDVDLMTCPIFTSTGKKARLLYSTGIYIPHSLELTPITNDLVDGNELKRRGESYDEFNERISKRLHEAQAHNAALVKEWVDEMFNNLTFDFIKHFSKAIAISTSSTLTMAKARMLGGDVRYVAIQYVATGINRYHVEVSSLYI